MGGPSWTLQSGASIALRRAALARIGEQVGADAGFWYGVDASGALRQWSVWRSTPIDRLFAEMAGATLPDGAATSDTAASLRARRGGWSIRSSPPGQRNTFVGWDRHVVLERLMALPVWPRFYAPARVHDQIRMLPFSRATFLGWFGFVTVGTRVFEARDLAVANRACRGVIRDLRSAALADDVSRDAYAIARPDGSIEHACTLATPWLSSDRRSLLRRFVREGRELACIDGAEVAGAVLEGHDGLRHLVIIRPLGSITAVEQRSLTPTEFAVASSAAFGLTISEIARERAISENTVKTLLQRVYKKLGVSSRIELARALA